MSASTLRTNARFAVVPSVSVVIVSCDGRSRREGWVVRMGKWSPRGTGDDSPRGRRGAQG